MLRSQLWSYENTVNVLLLEHFALDTKPVADKFNASSDIFVF